MKNYLRIGSNKYSNNKNMEYKEKVRPRYRLYN